MTAGLVLIDGCGDGDRDLAVGWSFFAGVTVVGTDAGSATGGYGLRLGQAPFNGAGIARRDLPADYANPLIALHWQVVAASPFAETPSIKLMKDGVTHVTVDLSLDGRIRVIGPGGLLAQSDAGAFVYATWYSVEIEAVIHDSTGSVKVYLGGHPDPVVEATGDTKHASASAVVNQVQFMNGEQQRVYIDDLFAVDLSTGDRIGVGFIKSLPLDSDAETDWTPSTGSTHYTLVDERPFSATDYVSTDGAGNRDRYGTDDASNVEPILGARVVGRMQGDSGAQARFVFSDGSTHATGATRSLGAAASYEDVFDEPPAGGAWGASSGLQVGVECVTGAGPVSRLNGMALELLLLRPPGEVRVTRLEFFAGATQQPGAVRATHEDVSVSTIGDPSETRVTHEHFSVGTGDEPSAVRVTHLYWQALVKITGQLPALLGCDLLLQVFDDDRATVRWQASTNLEVAEPYLVMPDKYAEQEIDPAAGAATLSTVNCTVIDKRRTVGDQDSGWMTHKLAHDLRADIQGRRARLLRAISDDPLVDLEVVIDGVAGTPKMDSSYAAYSFDIRDTRESERKIRAFATITETDTVFLPAADVTPANGLLGTLNGYGYNSETDTYLLPPIIAGLTGVFNQNTTNFPNQTTGTVDITGNAANIRTVTLETYQAWAGQVTEEGPETFGVPLWSRVRFPNLAIWWRPVGDDEWNIIGGSNLVMDIRSNYLRYNPGVVTTDLGDGLVRIDRLAFGDDRIGPAGLDEVSEAALNPPPYDPPRDGAALPAHGQNIELMLMAYGPPSGDVPIHVEGLTAGQFAKNVYDGLYSARDSAGNLVPSGIRYHTASLLKMTDPVRLRLKEPITDARDWLEKYIYAPTGWIPALDRFGRISPVYQGAPTDIYSLPLIYDAITEPAPEWDAGQRIVNVVRFTYPRDYVPDPAVEPETLDGLSDVDVVVQFENLLSIERNGPQVLEIDGRAFRALGDQRGDPVLDGGMAAELGHRLAFDRRDHVLNRYALGAPSMRVAVRREFTPTLRAGSWVRVWLSWFPDYVTRRRGLIALCQVTAIGDHDCVWRQVTMEQVVPLGLYDEDESTFAVLIGKRGRVLVNDDGEILIRS